MYELILKSGEAYQTTKGTSASMASSIPLAARGGLNSRHQRRLSGKSLELIIAYGTKMAEAVAPVSLTASLTLAKTGRSRCVEPAFLGLVPPTTLVPRMRECPIQNDAVRENAAKEMAICTVGDRLLSVKTIGAYQHQVQISKSGEGLRTFLVFQ
jgi:hypothetical protein